MVVLAKPGNLAKILVLRRGVPYVTSPNYSILLCMQLPSSKYIVPDACLACLSRCGATGWQRNKANTLLYFPEHP
jgi:hypothetical protein